MAKQEVLDAINATVAPNNIKGITADSLRNVLTLMAENAGSGSGEGALRVMIPIDVFPTGENEMEFTPEYWETTKTAFEVVFPGISVALDPVVEELFRHNAEVYSLLMEKGAKNEGVMCLLDMSAWIKEMMVAAYATTEGVAISFDALSYSIPSAAIIIEAEPAEAAAEMVIPTGVAIMPLHPGSYGFGIEPFNAVELRADGSVRMYIDASGIDYVYVPENDESVLSENQKATNALLKQQGYGGAKEVRMCFSATGSDSYNEGTRAVYGRTGEVHYLQYDKTTGTTYFKQAIIADDGSVTVTTIGVINPPTA